MRISEVISRLKVLASEVGDVDVVVFSDESSCYEAAAFEIQNVNALENSWVSFEKNNKDQVVRVF